MKFLCVGLLVVIGSITSFAQKMTDRDLDRLAGKVKVVELWRQKVAADGTPLEEGKTVSEMTYDEEGNLSTHTRYSDGTFKTTYFLVKGARVSKSGWIGEDPTAKMTLPKGMKLEKKKDGPFDFKYKYKYDKNDRIAEILGDEVGRNYRTSVKYFFEDAGRIISSKEQTGSNLTSEVTQSFKYDDKGNIAEVVTKSTMYILKGIGTSGIPETAKEKRESSVRYSDYTLDKDGNWTNRKGTALDSDGKITSRFVEVRFITYF